MGEYQPGVDYVFDHNVAIIDGNLRIYCATKGVLGQVPWTPLNPPPPENTTHGFKIPYTL